MNETILIVDDEPKIVELARSYLENSGFRVQATGDGQTALILARTIKPDLVVLDLNLPVMEGLDVCRGLRRESDVPIIMLTARVEETDRLIGLELGADDYITKPFSPRELVARVRALLRRAKGEILQVNIVRIHDFEIDLEGHTVKKAGVPLHFSPNEFKLLAILAQHPGQTMTRELLMDHLHGVVISGFDRSIDAHIKNIRKKIEPNPNEPEYILTVYGIGYKFNDQVNL